ncbi:MAG TPA: ice-binding family protein [Archangium sp.]|uniref:ice-binding family protein n=1 Tax=Archangium sp. TaxID=1872627 RepID=UPI002EDAC9C5
MPLGTTGTLAILAKTGVSTVPPSSVTGNVGVSPAAATYLTGFSLVADPTNVFATSPQIVGKAYASNYAVPTPSNLTTAVSNMESAYTNAAGRPTPNFLNLGTGNIGGKTLVPGLYKWAGTVTIPADVTLSGGPTDVWILQVAGDLSMSASKRITLLGGALAKNVFWQVAGRTTLGTGAHFEGVLLCKTDVTLQTGATMNGRILSQTNVALQQATVTQPAN